MKARFRVGDKVWVRDVGCTLYHRMRGFRIRGPVVIQEVHSHPGRHPFYPGGEGYSFNYSGVGSEADNEAQDDLWWDCYPGSRVWATREEASAARVSEAWVRQAISDGRLPQ